MRKLTKEEFIERAIFTYGNKFDYALVNYFNNRYLIKIRCKDKCHIFECKPKIHLKGKGCPICILEVKLTKEKFIDQSGLVHNYKYNYSQVKFINKTTKVCIICKIHGLFLQTPVNHLIRKQGCSFCARNVKISKEILIEKGNIAHNYKYDYSKVEIGSQTSKVEIVCPVHGSFWQIPRKHFLFGCAGCAGVKKSNTIDFIYKANIIHKYKFDYTKSVYNSCISKIIIICPIHREFYQTPNSHLRGNGCKHCSIGNSSKKEQDWLDQLQLPRDSRHRNVIFYIDGKRYYVDGHIPGSNIIYEFLGNYWHGNPSMYNAKNINGINKHTFGELFIKTVEKIKAFRKAGYKVISIWEKRYDKDVSYSRKSIKSK